MMVVLQSGHSLRLRELAEVCQTVLDIVMISSALLLSNGLSHALDTRLTVINGQLDLFDPRVGGGKLMSSDIW